MLIRSHTSEKHRSHPSDIAVYIASQIFMGDCGDFDGMGKEYRPKVNVTVTADLMKWINEQIECGRFASKSHAMCAALMWYRRYLEKGELPPK